MYLSVGQIRTMAREVVAYADDTPVLVMHGVPTVVGRASFKVADGNYVVEVDAEGVVTDTFNLGD
jgi:hypothetical protein